jgi:hypothetical protein
MAPQWPVAIEAASMPKTFQDYGCCSIGRWYLLRPGEVEIDFDVSRSIYMHNTHNATMAGRRKGQCA